MEHIIVFKILKLLSIPFDAEDYLNIKDYLNVFISYILTHSGCAYVYRYINRCQHKTYNHCILNNVKVRNKA